MIMKFPMDRLRKIILTNHELAPRNHGSAVAVQ